MLGCLVSALALGCGTSQLDAPGPAGGGGPFTGAPAPGATTDQGAAGSGVGGSGASDSDVGGVDPSIGWSVAISAQPFPGENPRLIAGTSDDLWVVGEPAPSGTTGSSDGPLNCGPDRWDATSLLWRRRGGHWEQVGSPATTWPTALHRTDAGSVWLVALGGAVFHFDGQSWQKHEILDAEGLEFDATAACNELSLQSVFARSDDDVWVVGYVFPSTLGPGLILHFDGSSWKRHAVGAEDGLFDVWASSSSNAWAVGASGYSSSLVFHFDGTQWQRVDPGTNNYLFSVIGTSENDVWAAGNTAIITHFDGARWTVVEPSQPWAEIRSLAGNAAWGIWGLRTSHPADSWRQSLLRWDGLRWQEQAFTDSEQGSLTDIWLTPSGELLGAGSGKVLRFR
jgi:hypothetical protein